MLLSSLFLLLGSYCSSSDDGILLYRFDEDNASSQLVSSLSGISNPSFLTLSPDHRFIFAVGEDEGLTSTANAVSLSLPSGSMRLLSSQPTQGGAPCNITLSPDGKSLFTANYFGGNISVFSVSADGTLSDARVVNFSGHGVDSLRQTKPYLHSVAFTPDGRFLLANDLGTDHIYQFAASPDGIDLSSRRDIFVKAGSGPRHLSFAPDGRSFYLISELSGELFVFSYSEDGHIEQLQCIKADQFDAHGSADVHVSPDGRHLYASHRLRGDGISIFRILPDGRVEPIGYQPTGLHPRNFALTPDGRFLLVACRDSNEVQLYERNPITGLLTDTSRRISMPQPVFVKFFVDTL